MTSILYYSFLGRENPGFQENNEQESIATTSNSEETSGDEESESSSSGEDDDDEEEDDDDSSSQSTLPPQGDTFSLSSSLRRSDRGSPVPYYIDEDDHAYSEIANTPITSWMPSVNESYAPSIKRMTNV